MKAGIWKKKIQTLKSLSQKQWLYPEIKGFILLETLICLAVLAILLPFGHAVFINGFKKYHETSFKRTAALIAREQMTIAEMELFKKSIFPPDTENRVKNQQWIAERMIVNEKGALKNVRITIRNRNLIKNSKYVLEEWILKR